MENENEDEIEPCIKLKNSIEIKNLQSGVNLENDDSDLIEDSDSEKETEKGDNDENDVLPPNLFKNFMKGYEQTESTGHYGLNYHQLPFKELSQKMENVTDDGGVKKLIEKEGVSSQINRNLRISYHYSSYSESGPDYPNPYDSTILKNKMQRTWPHLHGLVIALLSMRPKEKAWFLVSPEYAYGLLGCPPRIPENAVLLFYVEIIEVFDYVAAEKWERLSKKEKRTKPFQERMEAAYAYQRMGNDKVKRTNNCRDEEFKKKLWKEAKSCYKAGLEILISMKAADDEQSQILYNLYFILLTNIAMTYLELEQYDRVCQSCNEALNLPGKVSNTMRAKLYFRYAKAKMHQNDFSLALNYGQKAQKFSPNSKEIPKLLELIVIKKHKAKNAEKDLASKMFSGINLPKLKKESPSNESKTEDKSISEHATPIQFNSNPPTQSTSELCPTTKSTSDLGPLTKSTSDLGHPTQPNSDLTSPIQSSSNLPSPLKSNSESDLLSENPDSEGEDGNSLAPVAIEEPLEVVKEISLTSSNNGSLSTINNCEEDTLLDLDQFDVYIHQPNPPQSKSQSNDESLKIIEIPPDTETADINAANVAFENLQKSNVSPECEASLTSFSSKHSGGIHLGSSQAATEGASPSSTQESSAPKKLNLEELNRNLFVTKFTKKINQLKKGDITEITFHIRYVSSCMNLESFKEMVQTNGLLMKVCNSNVPKYIITLS